MLEFSLGILFLLLYQFYDRDAIRIEWKGVGAFLGFLALTTVARIATFSFLTDIDPSFQVPSVPPEILASGVWSLLLVFWEDAFFVLPIHYAFKKCKPWVAITVAVAMTISFAMGHEYQGYWGMAVTALYPYVISYRLGKKYGYGTIMVCHILYDFATVYTIYFMPYLLI